MLAFIVFGLSVYLLSILTAYAKGLNNKKKLLSQIILIVLLLLGWLFLYGIEIFMVKSGFTIDRLTIGQVTIIELFINLIYPFIIAPLIAIFFAIFKEFK